VFSVIFEVHPKPDQWDAYLGNAKMLRPELERVDGFVDNVRYKSLTRGGWLLSLSGWRDEKAVVRWRTATRHHMAQEKGRSEILLDYHLRVGQITQDTIDPDNARIGLAVLPGKHPDQVKHDAPDQDEHVHLEEPVEERAHEQPLRRFLSV